jgi:adenylate kinase
MHQVLSVLLVVLSLVPSMIVFGEESVRADCPHSYVIILYGAPGSGRATMAIRLRRDFAFPTISLPSLLTTHVLEGTSLGTKGRDYFINGGELPPELLPAILCDRLIQPDCVSGAFLDDMSLTVQQILDIEKQLGSRFQFLIVNIDSSDDFLVQRVERRLVCYKCGYVYDDTDPSTRQRTRCEFCSSPLQRRQGDTPEVVKSRLETYRSQVSPLLKIYKEQGILVQIPGNRKYDDVYKDIVQTIEHRTGLVASKTCCDEPLLAQE